MLRRIVIGALVAIAACGDDNHGSDPPKVEPAILTTDEDTPIVHTVDARDSQGRALVLQAQSPSHGTVTIDRLQVTYTPSTDYNGADSFTVTASNGMADASAQIAVMVRPVNDPPAVAGDSFATSEDAPLVRSHAALLANDSDVERDTLSVMSVGSATNGTVSSAGTDVTFTPARDFNGMASFQYTVSDGAATSTGTVTITVGGENDAPVAVDDTATTPEDTAVDIAATALVANDTDTENQTLTVTAVGNATNGTVVLAGGVATFTPAANFNGTATFEYTVSDGAATDLGTVTITVTPVNDAPVAADDTATTPEDTAVDIAGTALVANDTDTENQALTVTAAGNATNGTVVLAGGVATFTPAANFTGTATFEYTVSDGAATDLGTVTITVTPINDAPVAVDDTATTPEDTAVDIAATALVANDTDAEGQTLTVTAVGNATNGTVVLAGGVARFTPAANFTGMATFEYTVSDGTLTDTGLVTIAVAPVNDAPVAVDDTATTPEDTAVDIAGTALVANDTDTENQTLTVTAVGNATNGTVVLAGGVARFTPAANFNGTATFEYTVSDGAATDLGKVTITVTPVNDAPVAVDDTAATPEDTAVDIAATTLIANDTDAEGQTLTLTAVGNATNGTVVLASGVATFTPAVNFTGIATFEYTVSDGTLTDIGRVRITVGPTNDAPVAVDDTAATSEDTAVDVAAIALIANDTDAEGQTLTVTAVGNATNGTVVLAGGVATFTPAANFNGAATFEYTVSDGTSDDIGLVIITVAPVDDPPIAVDDTATTAEDTPLVVAASLLTANDTEVDGQSLTVTTVGGSNNGTVVLAGGNVTFTPATNFSGTASFSYVVSDGTSTDTGAVTVTVTAVNDPPVAVDDTGATLFGTPLVLSFVELLANDIDAEGSLLSVTAAQNAVNGTAVLGATSVTFTPATNFSGLASFDYVVSDGTASDVGTVTITVAAPFCGDGVVTAPEACDDADADDTDGCTTQCVIGAPCTAAAAPGGDRFTVDPATGHCYVSFDDELTTFSAAQAACVGVRGHLVTISSAIEQGLAQSVQNTVQNPWIGANEDGNDTDAIFHWVTGESFGFASFAPGQPDDDAAIDGNGDCLHMANAAGQWNDTNCTLATFVVGRICELHPASCGDGVLQSAAGEQCDDGNVASGDGCSATCQNELLASFTFTGALGNEASRSADGAAPAPGLASIPAISRGTGLTPSAAADAFSSTGFTLTPTIDLNDYYTITVTPAAGFTMKLVRLELDERRSGTGIRNWVVRSSLDGFTADLATFAVPDDANVRANQPVPLGPAFSNLAAPVEFRVYGFAAEQAAGTWRLDNIELYGITTGP